MNSPDLMLDREANEPETKNVGTVETIVTLAMTDIPMAASLLAQGMRDNPLHLAVFGRDRRCRQRRLLRLFNRMLPYVHRRGRLLGIRSEGNLVAVLGLMPPSTCQPSYGDMLHVGLHIALTNPPWVAWRCVRWLRHWAQLDPDTPHWHLGPLTVQAAYRRCGLARRLMQYACDEIACQGQDAWLETDMTRNVDFYTRLGFQTVKRSRVLGVPNWFMLRRP